MYNNFSFEEIKEAIQPINDQLIAYCAYQPTLDFIFGGIRNICTGDDEPSRIHELKWEDFIKVGLTAKQVIMLMDELAADRALDWECSAVYTRAVTMALFHIRKNKQVNLHRCAQIWVEIWLKQTCEEEEPGELFGEYVHLLDNIYKFIHNAE